MDSVLKFLSMGGYAAFVWPAVGTVALGMLLLLWHTLRTLKQRERTLAALTRNGSVNEDAET
jgi:heme exporter protein CcmD